MLNHTRAFTELAGSALVLGFVYALPYFMISVS